MRKKETAPLRCVVVATRWFSRDDLSYPFWRRRSKNATDRVDVLGGGDLLLLPKGRRQRRLTHHHHHHHHRRHTLGADQIEFVYLYSPSSSSFAGMRLSLSSRRSRGNEEERSPQDKDKRTSTDQHHRFFLFPNHNRDPNKNTTGVARKDHQNVCCETEPKTREASRDSSGHLPSEWASEEEWRDVRRRQVDGRRGQLQRHVHER